MDCLEYIKGYSRCECGAITLFVLDGKRYSCKASNLRKYVPNIDLRRIRKYHKTYSCDHCVNNYGMDICACGSGEDYHKCHGGFDECGKPMQVFGGYDRVIANNSWLA